MTVKVDWSEVSHYNEHNLTQNIRRQYIKLVNVECARMYIYHDFEIYMLSVEPNQLQIMVDQSVLSKYIISHRFCHIEKKNLWTHLMHKNHEQGEIKRMMMVMFDSECFPLLGNHGRSILCGFL